MQRTIKARISNLHGSTAYWDSKSGFIPKAGEIIIYDDYKSEVVDGVTVYTPGVKIGSGNAYVQDLAFIDAKATQEILDRLNNHINDTDVHVTLEDKEEWNDKVSIEAVVDQTIVFTK